MLDHDKTSPHWPQMPFKPIFQWVAHWYSK